MGDFFCHSWLEIIHLYLFSIFFFSIKWFFHRDLGFYMFVYHLGAHMIVVVFVCMWLSLCCLGVTSVLSQHDDLVFVVVV